MHASGQGLTYQSLAGAGSILLRMLKILARVVPVSLSLLILIQIITASLPVVQLYLTKELINAIGRLFQGDRSVQAYTYTLLIIQTSALVFVYVLNYVEHVTTIRAQQKLKFYLQERITDKASSLPLVYYDRPEFHDHIERTAFGVEMKGFSVFVLLMSVVRNFISITAMIGTLFAFHWLLSVCLIAMLLPKFLIHLKTGKLRFNQMHEQTPTARKMQYYLHLLHSRQSAKEIRLFGIAEYLREGWRRLFWKNTNAQLRLEKRNGLRSSLTQIADVIVAAAATCVLIYYGMNGSMTIGDYVALTQALVTIQPMIHMLGQQTAMVYEETLFIGEMFSFLDLQDEEEAASGEKRLFPERLEDGIRVENLSFRYPGNDTPVIHDLSFRIRKGEKIVIIGENGSGKSTLVKCLLGLYKPTSGAIYYDGTPVEQYDNASMRSRISAVFQDYVSYYLTLRENIGFGKVSELDNDLQIAAAAKKSGVDLSADKLPSGLDTPLGPIFEGGRDLSGGQWQRLAIGRAFMSNADLIVLDEPSSALDPIAEEEIYRQFTELTGSKTTIMVSHRLGSCKMADRILVMKNGRLVEEGTHDELVRYGGEYAGMFKLQARRYG